MSMEDAWEEAERAARDWGVSGIRLIGPYHGSTRPTQYDAVPWSIHGIRGEDWPVGIGSDPWEALTRLAEQVSDRIAEEDWPLHPVSGARMQE